jgi:predicted RNase H-like HicB family nuclease
VVGVFDEVILTIVERLMEYVVIFEKGENSYRVSVPDLPRCIAVSETLEEVRELIAEAIKFHIKGLWEDRDVVPQPSSSLPSKANRVYRPH